jgi:TetR/AcrR family transcriptional regulator
VPRTPAPLKKTRDAEASRAKVVAAAAEEFASRGFDGAKVDAIAARAGVNKAMLYYHFDDKAALYREVVGDMFASTAASLQQVRASGGSPEQQLATVIEVIAREGMARPHFPLMWLRELADGGRHLGPGNFTDMLAIVGAVGGILKDGESTGRLRAVPPFLAQLGIVGPLFMFLATTQMRQRLRGLMPSPPPEVPPDLLVKYVQDMTLGALRAEPTKAQSRPARPGRKVRSAKHAGQR